MPTICAASVGVRVPASTSKMAAARRFASVLAPAPRFWKGPLRRCAVFRCLATVFTDSPLAASLTTHLLVPRRMTRQSAASHHPTATFPAPVRSPQPGPKPLHLPDTPVRATHSLAAVLPDRLPAARPADQ